MVATRFHPFFLFRLIIDIFFLAQNHIGKQRICTSNSFPRKYLIIIFMYPLVDIARAVRAINKSLNTFVNLHPIFACQRANDSKEGTL